VTRYTKPYLTIPEQIALLERRGMAIPDRNKAEEYLGRLGYYRLSAYWVPFRESVVAANGTVTLQDRFKAGTSFKTVLDLYAFDKALRLQLLDVLERIEISMRTHIALQLGQFDPWAHRQPALLNRKFTALDPVTRKTKHSEWLSRLDDKEATSKEEFAVHFRAKYTASQMPVWVAPWATYALIENERFEGEIWEPACGDGTMARVLERTGCPVIATDLYDRGYGKAGYDFLSPTRPADQEHVDSGRTGAWSRELPAPRMGVSWWSAQETPESTGLRSRSERRPLPPCQPTSSEPLDRVEARTRPSGAIRRANCHVAALTSATGRLCCTMKCGAKGQHRCPFALSPERQMKSVKSANCTASTFRKTIVSLPWITKVTSCVPGF
jgi:hypothetical protein